MPSDGGARFSGGAWGALPRGEGARAAMNGIPGPGRAPAVDAAGANLRREFENACHGRYFPLNTGLRFSRKAARPSSRSSVGMVTQ